MICYGPMWAHDLMISIISTLSPLIENRSCPDCLFITPRLFLYYVIWGHDASLSIHCKPLPSLCSSQYVSINDVQLEYRKFSNRGATPYRGAPPPFDPRPSGFLDVFGHISAKIVRFSFCKKPLEGENVPSLMIAPGARRLYWGIYGNLSHIPQNIWWYIPRVFSSGFSIHFAVEFLSVFLPFVPLGKFCPNIDGISERWRNIFRGI